MNSNNEVMAETIRVAEAIGASAAIQSGIDYVVDARTGINRVHARVSTPQDTKQYFREGHYRALSIALGAMGGNPSGTSAYATLGSRMRSVSRSKSKGWKAPGYITTTRRHGWGRRR